MYSFNLSHSPSYHLIPTFFFSFSKKTKQCLVENNAQRKKLYFAAQSGTGFIFYFSRRYSMNHPADFDNICFCTLQDTCGGPDTELKLDLMNLTSYIILWTIYLCTFDTSKYIIWNHKCASQSLKTRCPLLDDKDSLYISQDPKSSVARSKPGCCPCCPIVPVRTNCPPHLKGTWKGGAAQHFLWSSSL